MRTALVIDWSGEGKATLSGVSNPFILLDSDVLGVLGIDRPGTHTMSEAIIRITDDSGDPWKGILEYRGATHELVAYHTSGFLGSETYTLSLAKTPTSV